MKVFLAGTDLLKNYPDELMKSKYQLASFFNIKEEMMQYLLKCEDFLLDSGAYTFLQGRKSVVWDEYVERYAHFIKKHDVKHYFEMDIDPIVGYEKVKEFRNTLERITGKQSIPVWHRYRGFDEYIKLCEEYEYIAIGGLAIKEIKTVEYNVLPFLINEAHKRGAKVHGLGFTSTSYFDRIKFDTVDSTTWNVGGKFGNICVFDEKSYMKKRIQKKGMRCIKQKELMLHNWNEWVKFQKFADKHL